MEAATKIFNRADRFAQGWYWAMPARDLKKKVKRITLLGRDLVFYRDANNQPVALDARCPHIGASLENGQVEQGIIKCPLHGWQFDPKGQRISNYNQPTFCRIGVSPAPRQSQPKPTTNIQSWSTTEQYGLIWIWIGNSLLISPIPHAPELTASQSKAHLSNQFSRKCHPNVVLINAIDANHFNAVHDLPLEIQFESKSHSQSAIQFSNTTRGGEASKFVQLIRPWYKKAVTYSMCYWYGSTGTVTLGPDFLHFYLMFALRPGENGTTEGCTILLTPKRAGPVGWLFNRAVLGITQLVANYFAKGDRAVFDSIKFSFKNPLAADSSISQFIKHVEQQPALTWKTWKAIL